jgi:thermitase
MTFRLSMISRSRLILLQFVVLLATMWIAGARDLTTNATPVSPSLRWNGKSGLVDANFDRASLETVLDRVAKESGWEVAYEPGLAKTVSARFKDVPIDRALGLLFASLSYSVVPETNSVPRLLVFETSKNNATRIIQRVKKRSGRIDNELVVKVKLGTDIDALARGVGAKVVGRDDALGIYRLRFDDAEAANVGAEALAQNPDVLGIDSNYWMESPVTPAGTPLSGGSAGFDMSFKAPEDGGCNVVVGLIDTPVQPFGDSRDSFLLPAVSVVGDGSTISTTVPTHGTSMASTLLSSLAANTKSGVSSMQVLPVDVYGGQVSTTTYDVALGISKAVTSGANILNLSLGSSGNSAFLHQVIQQASSQGVLVFAAAGNDPTTAPTYPAAYSEVVAVTAGTKNGSIANYANYGSFVDAVAPGNAVVYWDGQRYMVSGTSAATAYVSGLAAAQGNPCDPAFRSLGQRIASSLAPK